MVEDGGWKDLPSAGTRPSSRTASTIPWVSPKKPSLALSPLSLGPVLVVQDKCQRTRGLSKGLA